MPQITVLDGRSNRLLDTDTFRVSDVQLAFHAMRYHIYDPIQNEATVQFHTPDESLRKKIVRYATGRYGPVRELCTWIHAKNRQLELLDASNFRRMLQKDLARWWGDEAVVTGTAVRDVYYVSDGRANSTPSMIGFYNKRPLLYKGKAVASVFRIGNVDVLNPDRCVVYWLPKPWWEGFHARYRKVPLEFPWPTGFAFSNWCQRKGHARYGDGNIWIADMTQGQTVGSWTTTSLAKMHRGSGNEFGNGKVLSIDTRQIAADQSNKRRAMMILGRTATAQYGMVGARCRACGALLSSPYGHCVKCKANCSCDTFADVSGVWCKNCGMSFRKCDCSKKRHVSMSRHEHYIQYRYLGNDIVEGCDCAQCNP